MSHALIPLRRPGGDDVLVALGVTTLVGCDVPAVVPVGEATAVATVVVAVGVGVAVG